MAFTNQQGANISCECSDLIDELKADILEFGENENVTVWCRKKYGVELYINYDFLAPDEVGADELVDGEYIKYMSMGELLELLERQNAAL